MISGFCAACNRAATVSAIVLFLAPASTFAAFTAPERITVVTDFDYPPYLFTSEDGELKGIIRDKWRRWSERTGIRLSSRA
jgi:hypothetical protein